VDLKNDRTMRPSLAVRCVRVIKNEYDVEECEIFPIFMLVTAWMYRTCALFYRWTDNLT